jgi:hypothetical protein
MKIYYFQLIKTQLYKNIIYKIEIKQYRHINIINNS